MSPLTFVTWDLKTGWWAWNLPFPTVIAHCLKSFPLIVNLREDTASFQTLPAFISIVSKPESPLQGRLACSSSALLEIHITMNGLSGTRTFTNSCWCPFSPSGASRPFCVTVAALVALDPSAAGSGASREPRTPAGSAAGLRTRLRRAEWSSGGYFTWAAWLTTAPGAQPCGRSRFRSPAGAGSERPRRAALALRQLPLPPSRAGGEPLPWIRVFAYAFRLAGSLLWASLKKLPLSAGSPRPEGGACPWGGEHARRRGGRGAAAAALAPAGLRLPPPPPGAGGRASPSRATRAAMVREAAAEQGVAAALSSPASSTALGNGERIKR